MKKSFLLNSGRSLLAAAVFGMVATSCGGNKKAEQESDVDSVQVMEELVQAVETPVAGIAGTPYNAAFFNNADNKSENPTDSTYAQTASGLKYVIVDEGTGKSPNATDVVTVHYVGTLTNGTQFDSSIDRGEPTSLPLNLVIPGWTEGLQLMKEGGVAVFYIPSNLAYGEQGSYNPYTHEYTIPPSAPLLFWVQLISVGGDAQ